MKASHVNLVFLAVLLAVMGWMLWQQHPANTPASADPAAQVSLPPDDLKVPDLLATPAPPPVSLTHPVSLMPDASPLQPASFSWDEPLDEPYSAPLPPNPHAHPAWQERVPYRESQMQRGLFQTPMKLDK